LAIHCSGLAWFELAKQKIRFTPTTTIHWCLTTVMECLVEKAFMSLPFVTNNAGYSTCLAAFRKASANKVRNRLAQSGPTTVSSTNMIVISAMPAPPQSWQLNELVTWNAAALNQAHHSKVEPRRMPLEPCQQNRRYQNSTHMQPSHAQQPACCACFRCKTDNLCRGIAAATTLALLGHWPAMQL
jgi:hypothetical protein